MTRFWSCVGFDLDGTLVDSAADLAAAVNAGLGELARPALPLATIRPLIGGGARQLFDRALATAGGEATRPAADRGFAAMLDHYAAHLADETRAYPGLIPALDALADAGVTLAVATNKLERFAVELLDRLGLGGRFACVLGGDSLGPGRGKPAPDLLQAMVARCGTPAAYVGDSRFDVAAARAAGLPVVICAFEATRAEALALGGDAVIAGFDELPAALDGLAA